MSGAIGDTAAAMALPGFEPKRQTPDQAAIAARQALVQAEARVEADRRAHSPGCVAIDQKAVDRDEAAFAAASTPAADGAAGLSIAV